MSPALASLSTSTLFAFRGGIPVLGLQKLPVYQLKPFQDALALRQLLRRSKLRGVIAECKMQLCLSQTTDNAISAGYVQSGFMRTNAHGHNCRERFDVQVHAPLLTYSHYHFTGAKALRCLSVLDAMP